MFVASSYTASSRTRPSQERKVKQSLPNRETGQHVKGKQVNTSPVQRYPAQPGTTPSTPVAVPSPPRSENSSRNASRSSSRRAAKSKRHIPEAMHDSASVPPAVAALLAMTTIPPYRKLSKYEEERSIPVRNMSLSELVEEWHSMDVGDTTPLASSLNMEMLLYPPDNDNYLGQIASIEDTTERFPFPSRSQSNESMPSLDSDCLSMISSCEPATPQPSIRSASASKKERYMSSPEIIECKLDHPLLEDADKEPEYQSQPQPLQGESFKHIKPNKLRIQRSMSSFRSNLTASFKVLQSAANSISNFSIPTLPPDDYLSRSLFAPMTPVRSEMRPIFLSGPAAPQLRRYLNPTHLAPSRTGTPFDFHLHNSYIDQTDLISVSSMSSSADNPYSPCVIPMQTYRRNDGEVHPNTQVRDFSNTEAGRAMLVPGLKQREPRENSHFLRVCVLEMNMRREGKLDPNAAFKAQFWLPPRQVELVQERLDESVVSHGTKRVPMRWRGVVAS